MIIHHRFIFQNIDVVCMPKPGDFVHAESKKANKQHSAASSAAVSGRSSGRRDLAGDFDRDHKCYVTGWGRRTESELLCVCRVTLMQSSDTRQRLFLSVTNRQTKL